MKWLRKIYTGESLKQDLQGTLRRIDEVNGDMTGLCFLITLSTFSKCQLDILSAKEIHKPYYQAADLKAVGIAGNKTEGKALVERMLNDCLLSRGNADLRGYFESMGEEAYGTKEEVGLR